jgi:hypothetical protein
MFLMLMQRTARPGVTPERRRQPLGDDSPRRANRSITARPVKLAIQRMLKAYNVFAPVMQTDDASNRFMIFFW